jgi:phosphohistidine phosphatase
MGSEVKTLFLVRHAKSSWDDSTVRDKDRRLDDRGKRDTPKTGERLAKRHVKPDLILSSPARRALDTAKIIARKLGYRSKDIVVVDRLYGAAVDELLDVIFELDEELQNVMLFGHNPEFSALAYRLSNEISDMPTCAVAELSFNAKSWPDIGRAVLTKAALDCPRKS